MNKRMTNLLPVELREEDAAWELVRRAIDLGDSAIKNGLKYEIMIE